MLKTQSDAVLVSGLVYEHPKVREVVTGSSLLPVDKIVGSREVNLMAHSITNAEMIIAGPMIESNTNMVMLNLASNSIGGHAQDKGMGCLVKAIRGHALLTELDLSDNHFDSSDCVQLGLALVDLPVLVTFNFEENYVGQLVDPQDRSYVYDFKSGQWMCDHEYVDGHNTTFPCERLPTYVRPVGAFAIIKALAELPRLRALNLKNNNITDESVYALLDLIENAKLMQNLDLRDNHFNGSKWARIKEAQQNTSPAPGRLLVIRGISKNAPAPNAGGIGRRPSVISSS
jgi:Leucine-rich repeat (LRR) protein